MKIVAIIFAMSLSLFALELEVMYDYNKAIKEAKKQNKDVYMFITSETCRWCRKFEDVTLKDEVTIKTLQKDFIILAVTRYKDPIPSKFFAKRVPKHYFITPDEREIYSFLGYWNPEDFASFLSEVYKKKLKM